LAVILQANDEYEKYPEFLVCIYLGFRFFTDEIREEATD
jgi:hypothetical protein